MGSFRWVALALVALAACSQGPQTSPVAATTHGRVLGTFGGVLDTASGAISFWAPDGSLTPIGLTVVQDGPGGQVMLTTTNVTHSELDGVPCWPCQHGSCPDDTAAFGGDVTVTNTSGQALSNVYVEITQIDTAKEACNSDTDVDSVTSVGGGLWSYGPIAVGAGSTRRWRLKKPTATPYTFKGRVVEADSMLPTLAPAPVSGASVVMRLQSAEFSWTNPGDPTFDHVEIWARAAGSATYWRFGQTADRTTTTYTATDLLPLAAYDFEVIAVGAVGATAQAAVVLHNQTTVFSGTAADWVPCTGPTACQVANSVTGNHVSFTWTDTRLVVGYSNSSDSAALLVGEELWIAFGDRTNPVGESRTTSVGANDVIWPFVAEYLVKYAVTGDYYGRVRLYRWSGTSYDLMWNAQVGNPWVTDVNISRDGSTISLACDIQ